MIKHRKTYHTDPLAEYLKIYKLIRKQEARAKIQCPLQFNRCIKKVVSLLRRARQLEEILRVPEERRYTNAYS